MALQLSIGQFYGIDSLVEFFIIIVALIISYYSYKIYKLVREEYYKFFSLAFLLMAIGFLFKIISNITLIHTIKIENVNFIVNIFREYEWVETLNFISFIFYKVLFISGFLFLFFIVTNTKNKESRLLLTYFGILTILLSVYFSFIFHLTLVLLVFSLTIHFYENSQNLKTRNGFFVFFAFFGILISQVVFIFTEISPIFYLVGEIILLLAFVTLLINQIKLKTTNKKTDNRSLNFKNMNQNEKKNKIGSYKRYIGNSKRK